MLALGQCQSGSEGKKTGQLILERRKDSGHPTVGFLRCGLILVLPFRLKTLNKTYPIPTKKLVA